MQALVIVDMQNDFCHPDGALAKRGIPVDGEGMKSVATANQKLIDAFHQNGFPVIFVKTEHGPWTDSSVWRGRVKDEGRGIEQIPVCQSDWGKEFFTLQPSEEDRVVTKHRYSSFFGTNLDVILRAQGVNSLIITGVATNVCVEATVRDAFMRDYDTIVVPEACAGNTPEEHRIGLHNIGTYFGRLVSLPDALRKLEAGQVA